MCFSFHVQLAPCFPDKAAQREVLQVEVQCRNKEHGCSWIGRLSDYINVRALHHHCIFLLWLALFMINFVN
jgi:hypothetical protein